MLTLGLPCLVAGCGVWLIVPSRPPLTKAQVKKAQAYMANYREQIIADNKAKAKAGEGRGKRKSP